MATLLLSLQVLQSQADAAAQFLQQNQPDTMEGQYEDRPPDPEPDEEEAAEHMRRAEHYRARLSQALYPGAGVSCLEADVLLFGWRTKYAVKNRAFDELVRMLHSSLLPSDNLLPPSLYMFRKVSSSSCQQQQMRVQCDSNAQRISSSITTGNSDSYTSLAADHPAHPPMAHRCSMSSPLPTISTTPALRTSTSGLPCPSSNGPCQPVLRVPAAISASLGSSSLGAAPSCSR